MSDLLHVPEKLRRGGLRVWLLLSAVWSALVVQAALEAPVGRPLNVPFLGAQYWDTQDRIFGVLAPWLLTIVGVACWWAYLGVLANNKKNADR